MINLNKFIFLISIVFFYYVFPLASIKNTSFDKHHNFTTLFYSNYNIFLATLFILIFCFVFIKLTKVTNIKIIRENIKNDKLFYSILKIILIICIAYILFDVLKVLKFWFENYANLNVDSRAHIYKEFLSKRLTYVKIAIITSVFLFKTDKVLSLLGFLSIIVLDLISLSRFNIAILGIVFLLNNFNINKKNIFFLLLVISILFSYRPISQYFLGYNSFDLEFFIEYFLRHASGEFYAVFSTLMIFVDNFLITIKLFLKLSTILNMLLFYINDNINFLLRGFFYYPGLDYYNYWHHHYMDNYFANHGATYIMAYPLVLVLYYYILKKFVLTLVNQGYDINFFRVIICFLLSMSFRSNMIHEIGFIIKFIMLIVIINVLTKNIIKIYNRKLKKKINL